MQLRWVHGFISVFFFFYFLRFFLGFSFLGWIRWFAGAAVFITSGLTRLAHILGYTSIPVFRAFSFVLPMRMPVGICIFFSFSICAHCLPFLAGIGVYFDISCLELRVVG